MIRRAIHVHAPGEWPEHRQVGTISLTFVDRHRRRMRMEDDQGAGFLLDLPRAVVLGEGDGLELDLGGYIRVHAAEEDLAEARCTDALSLARVAWHLGNRHLPVQIARDGIRLRWDDVIVDMLQGLGAEVTRLRAPFDPERGAYAAGHHHDH